MGTLTHIIKNIHIMIKAHNYAISVYPVWLFPYRTYNDKQEKRP